MFPERKCKNFFTFAFVWLISLIGSGKNLAEVVNKTTKKIQNLMKTCNAVKKLALVMALSSLVLSGARGQSTIAYNYPAGILGNQPNGPWALGNEFSVTTPIQVTALGAFDPSDAAFGNGGVEVAIYSVALGATALDPQSGTTAPILNSGTMVVGQVLFSGSYTPLPGTSTVMQNITPVTLELGTYIVVANNYGLGGALDDFNPYYDPSLISANNDYGVTFTANGYYQGNGSPPNSLNYANVPGYGTLLTSFTGGWNALNVGEPPEFAAGNFEFSAVPEPSSLAIAGVALLGLVCVGRSNLRRHKLA